MKQFKTPIAVAVIVLAFLWIVGIGGGIENGTCGLVSGLVQAAVAVGLEWAGFKAIGNVVAETKVENIVDGKGE